ncbi:transferase family-domain-containing protein [Aspergillus carlsbadensis]|nr:transferase family-domain-containing protein [Aspergillus carlsbadensis]
MATTHYLSPVDHIFAPFNPCYCLCFHSRRPLELVPHIRQGIDKLLTRYPFIAGEVVPCSQEAQCADHKPANAEGLLCIRQPSISDGRGPMLLVREQPNLSIDAISSVQFRTGVDDLLLAKQLTAVPLMSSPSRPRYVLQFAATVARDGLALAMSFSHLVFDATGAAHLLQSLAECCRGDQFQPCHLPDQTLRRELWTVKSDSKHEAEFERAYTIPDNAPPPPSDAQSIVDKMAETTTVWRLRIPARKVRSLKAACTKLLRDRVAETDGQGATYVSSLDVLTDYLAYCLRKGAERDSEPTGIGIPVNLRERLNPAWPNAYMGNLVTYATSASRELGLAPEDLVRVYGIAREIRKTLLTFNDGYIRSFVSWLSAQGNLNQVGIQFPAINFTSWRHLNLYELDFGGPLGTADEIQPLGLTASCGLIMPKRNPAFKGIAGGTVSAEEDELDWEVFLYLNDEEYSRLREDGLVHALAED